MRSIEVSSQFKRDAKKNYLSLLTPAWGEVLNCLTMNRPEIVGALKTYGYELASTNY